MNPIQRLAEYAGLNHMNPGAVPACPTDHAFSQTPLWNVIGILRRRRDDGTEAIGREKGLRSIQKSISTAGLLSAAATTGVLSTAAAGLWAAAALLWSPA